VLCYIYTFVFFCCLFARVLRWIFLTYEEGVKLHHHFNCFSVFFRIKRFFCETRGFQILTNFYNNLIKFWEYFLGIFFYDFRGHHTQTEPFRCISPNLLYFLQLHETSLHFLLHTNTHFNDNKNRILWDNK